MEYHFLKKEDAYNYIYNCVWEEAYNKKNCVLNIGTDKEPIVYMRFKHFCVRFKEGEILIRNLYVQGCKEYNRCGNKGEFNYFIHKYIIKNFYDCLESSSYYNKYIDNIYRLVFGYLSSMYELISYEDEGGEGFIDDDIIQYEGSYHPELVFPYKNNACITPEYIGNLFNKQVKIREYLTVKEILMEGCNIYNVAKRIQRIGEFESSTGMFIYADAYARAAGLCAGRYDNHDVLTRRVIAYLDYAELMGKDDAMAHISSNNSVVLVKDIFDEAQEYASLYRDTIRDSHSDISPIAYYQIAYYLSHILTMAFEESNCNSVDMEMAILDSIMEVK